MALLLSLLLLLSIRAYAEPVVNVSKNFYPVLAQSKKELWQSLNAETPVYENGNSYYAYTYTYVSWKFSWVTINNYCRVTAVTVSVDVTYTLPELESSSPKVREIWDKWYPRLVFHERGHENNAVRAARDVERGIYKLTDSMPCNELEVAVNKMGQKRMEILVATDKKYDKETEHGKTQGAWLFSYF